MAQYSDKSIYRNTRTQGYYLGILDYTPLPREADDRLFTINSTYHQRPDLLAYDLYNDSRLYWVFAARNRNTLKDPIWDFVKGQQIYIPKRKTLERELGL